MKRTRSVVYQTSKQVFHFDSLNNLLYKIINRNKLCTMTNRRRMTGALYITRCGFQATGINL